MRPRARMQLYRDMGQAVEPIEPRFVDRCVSELVGHDRGYDRGVSGANLPDVQIADPIIVYFQAFPDAASKLGIGHHVEQHSSSRPHEAE